LSVESSLIWIARDGGLAKGKEYTVNCRSPSCKSLRRSKSNLQRYCAAFSCFALPTLDEIILPGRQKKMATPSKKTSLSWLFETVKFTKGQFPLMAKYSGKSAVYYNSDRGGFTMYTIFCSKLPQNPSAGNHLGRHICPVGWPLCTIFNRVKGSLFFYITFIFYRKSNCRGDICGDTEHT